MNTVEAEFTPATQDVSPMEASERAMINQQVATAKQYPRKPSECLEKAKAIIEMDDEIAEACAYSLRRSGKVITGPSVRLAEIVCYSWKNVRCQARVKEIGSDAVVCEAVFIDLENNSGWSVEVRRRITDRNGQRYNEDMINVTAQAGMAIAYRNAVYKGVPQAVIHTLLDYAKDKAFGTTGKIQERKGKAITYFASQGIDEDTVLAHMGKNDVTELNRDDVEYLAGLVQAVKQGDSTIDEAFGRTRKGGAMPANGEEPKKPATLDELAKAKDPKPADKAPQSAESAESNAAKVIAACKAADIKGGEYDDVVAGLKIDADTDVNMLDDKTITKLLNAIEMAGKAKANA